MQVLFAAVRGVLALGIAVLFIDDARAQVPVEQGSGVITMTGTVEDIEVQERLLTVVGPDGTTIVGTRSPSTTAKRSPWRCGTPKVLLPQPKTAWKRERRPAWT
jgi:hypothetical protein